jgi:hypothetical protein
MIFYQTHFVANVAYQFLKSDGTIVRGGTCIKRIHLLPYHAFCEIIELNLFMLLGLFLELYDSERLEQTYIGETSN